MADISNKVVGVLLILVIVVSALGTFTFLNSFEPTIPSTSQSGQVHLRVAGEIPPAAGDAAVHLHIENPEEQ